ncbi:odorant receptor 45b-like [Euwallacea similis]|uniref:odorant receptor 45b-like n=1 Tax=Euwallacea similis TaxID=1736056 RepID=UPI0034504D44
MSLHLFLAFPKKVLTTTGIWPSKDYSLLYNLRGIFTILNISLLAFCLSYNAACHIDNFVKLSESLTYLISVINSLLKISMLSKNRKMLFELVGMMEMESFTRFEKAYEGIGAGLWKTVNVVQTVFWWQVNMAFVFLNLFPVIESEALPMDFPHFRDGPFHYPFYLFESVSMALAAYDNMAVDLLTVGVISVTAMQLQILNKKLVDTEKNVKKLGGNTETMTLVYLVECCQHYNDIEKYIKCLLEVFSVNVFVQLGASIVAICNSGILILTVDPVSIEALSLIVYLVTMFAELGMYCWFGNHVYMESLEVTTCCYLSRWNEHDSNVRKTLFMLMERSKRALQIRGLQFTTLNFPTFIAILKWSYSYFTLLRNYTTMDSADK